jgi:hypothetical protein
MFQDENPGTTGCQRSSPVEITITPDLEVSTPASPLFGEPIYILDINYVRFMKGKT